VDDIPVSWIDGGPQGFGPARAGILPFAMAQDQAAPSSGLARD
jgi:hypothetical protein